MSTFLGPVGSLIPVKCASTLTSSGGREVSFQDTLGKRKAFLGQVRAREWSVDIGLAKPHELSGLRWLAEYSSGPLVWYSPDAVVGNILTPGQAALIPGTHTGLEGPLVEVEPEVYVKSALPDAASYLNFPYRAGLADPIPVVPGQPVTVSAWLRGESRITVYWRDINGASLSHDSPATETAPTLTRMSRTLIPPSGAVQMSLALRGAQVAGPAVTLTDRLMPYSPGEGARRVVVHDLADAVIRATQDQQLGSLSFTVSEVG